MITKKDAIAELTSLGFRYSHVTAIREFWTHDDGRSAIIKLVADYQYAVEILSEAAKDPQRGPSMR